MTDEARKLRLTVTSQREIAAWTKNDKRVTLYAVEAKGWDGLPLRSFQELTVGEEIEYEARVYHHAEHGDSLTLKKTGAGFSKALSDLQDEVGALRSRVQNLERRLGDPETDVHPAQKDPDAPRGPAFLPEVVDRSKPDEEPGDDSPWGKDPPF